MLYSFSPVAEGCGIGCGHYAMLYSFSPVAEGCGIGCGHYAVLPNVVVFCSSGRTLGFRSLVVRVSD